jgi:hypothetical protein
MIFIGYPVNIKEALRLFNLPRTEESFEKEYQCINYIAEEAIKYGLQFDCIKKNIHFIGIECDHEQFGDLWSSYKSVDESIIGLLQLKAKVKEAIKLSGIDLSEIEITNEEEDVIVYNPEPYIIYG